MRCGLYGKLPAKRDFIAVAAPRPFLAVWEPWLQGSISASRTVLGPAWQEAFLRAPIWRFWLGQEVAGAAMIGALMPSVDGIGRYFPLTIFAQAEPGEALPPPELDTHDAWFGAAENLLLSALAEGVVFDDLTGALARLPQAPEAGKVETVGMAARDGTLVLDMAPASLGAALAGLRVRDQARTYAGMSYWWTIGGEDFAPRLVSARLLPDPYLFAGMLTGAFDDRAA